MPFRRPNRKTWTVSIRTPAGEVRRSTGTSDRKTAVAIERLVNALQAKRDRALLNAVVEGGLTLGALYDAHVANALEALRQHLICHAQSVKPTSSPSWTSGSPRWRER